jgi:protein-S-isoprenylcysteine O-methyltransferase Ste14
MTRTFKALLRMLILGAVGGIIGGSLAANRRQIAHTLFQIPPAMLAAIALICLFSIYWDAAAKNTAPAQSSESPWSRRFHLIVLNLSVLLLILPIPGLTRRFLPTRPILEALGLAIEIAGIAFAIWARRHLGANWSGEVRIATGHQLVRTGPYQYLRHPIYTGVLAMYLGAMLVSGQLHALIAMAVIALAYLRKLRLEEKILSQNFGPAFDDYRRHSWALLPPLL